MYYEEPYRKRTKNPRTGRRRRSFGGWLIGLCLRLIALLLALFVLGAGLLYALPVSLFMVEPEGVELSLADNLPDSRANILLLGLDALRESRQRSDTMVVASVGYGVLKLTSALRDTLVDIPGYGTGKLNAAYARGGAELVMRTLNETYSLNIMHYLAVDFTALVSVVDAIGGVEVPVTEAEADLINRTMDGDRARFEPLGYSAPALSQSGENIHLNGVQALYFARIRKLDDDFQRTRRQRALLSAMLKKIRGSLWNPAMLVRLGKALAGSVDTNMSVVQLLSLGEKALLAGAPETQRLPVDGSYTDDGSSLRIDDRQKNADAFRAFVYD
ncbi:MAG: LCP family protein [Clostridia bacterium]|nr:LCP family protein [Clostridia bacterium]